MKPKLKRKTATASALMPVADPQYDGFLAAMQTRFRSLTDKQPLFQTDVADLFAVYLAALPKDCRQFHTCHACEKFVNHFGGLVVIDPETGETDSPLWNETSAPDEAVQLGLRAIRAAVLKAKVTGPFLSSLQTWGQPETHGWHHMAVTPHHSQVFVPRTKRHGAFQEMAERKENYRLLQEGLNEYKNELADAAAIVSSGTLYRDEKVKAQAKWLTDIAALRASIKNKKHREQLVWLWSATAPTGWSHLNTTMFGTLLADLKAGASVEGAKRKFNDKMNPLRYQRPQAPPTDGNIKRAEELVAELGLEPALHRRFLRFEELRGILWADTATPSETKTGGVFGHLKAKPDQPDRGVIDCGVFTWTRFADEILPIVTKMDLLTPTSYANFTALVTAVNADAPPILQWDMSEHRNPVSWYVWMGGSPASQWGLHPSTYVTVRAVVKCPAHWDDMLMSHQPQQAILVLECAKESRQSGLALFPEILKGELREAKATIEAFSNKGKLEGTEEASACGLLMSESGGGEKVTLRVTRRGSRLVESYVIDRWK